MIVVVLFAVNVIIYNYGINKEAKQNNEASRNETVTNTSTIFKPTETTTINDNINNDNTVDVTNTITTLFYDEKEFSRSIQTKKTYQELEGTVVGIIPHHLVAADMISGFMEGVANDNIDTVVIIGPKHYNCNSKIITSDATWSTALGNLEADKDIIDRFITMQTLMVDNNKERMEADHAVSVLVPYVKKYLPVAKIVPILISGSLTMKEVEELSDFLTEVSRDKNILLLGSIDFSHYLNSKESAVKDKETILLIESKHYLRIKELGDDNIDSPNTLLTLMKYIDKMNYQDLRLIDHSSSLEKIGLPESSEVFKDGLTTYLIYASKAE